MPVGSFSKYLSGFTSDHTYQAVTVETETLDNKEIALTGMTWDLMNKGVSAGVAGKSNNPFDLDETDKAYELRKKKQLKFLSKKIRKAGLDFVFLQEVDIFTRNPLPKMMIEFIEVLKKIGWGVVHSDRADNLLIPLVTLYDANKLKFVAKRAVLPAKSGKFTSLEAEFIHIPTGAIVCFTNINLDHNTDHNNDITTYQQEQMEKGKLTVLGGCTHPGQNVKYHGLIGDENQATSVYSLMEDTYNENT